MAKIIRVPDEMLELIDVVKTRVEDYAWKGLSISNTDALRIIAKKAKDSGIFK